MDDTVSFDLQVLGREGGGAAVQRTGKVEQVAEDIDWMQRGPVINRYAKNCNRRSVEMDAGTWVKT